MFLIGKSINDMCFVKYGWMLLLGLISILLGYGLLKRLRKEEKKLYLNKDISEYIRKETLRDINMDRKLAIGGILTGIYLLFAYIVNIINKCL